MGERTKQILIVTVGVVLIAGGVIAYQLFKSRAAVQEIRCANGVPGYVINPDAFFLKYSGHSIVATADWKDTLVARIGIEDKALREATEAIEILDSRLRVSAMHQAPLACDPAGREEYARLSAYRAGEFERLVQLSKELEAIGHSGDASKRPRAETILKKEIPATAHAGDARIAASEGAK